MISRRALLLASPALLIPKRGLAWSHGNIAAYYSNFTGSNLSNWAAAIAGVSNAKLNCLGDSITVGTGGNGNGGTGAAPFSWPTKLAGLIARGSASSIFGTHNLGGGVPDYDPRVTISAGWGAGGTAYSGNILATTVAGTLSFTPTNQIDTIVIWYLKSSGAGSLTVNVDGGATLATINEANASPALASQTINTSLGVHTINLVQASGTVQIVGIVAFNSASRESSVYNGGWSGSQVQNYSDTSSVVAEGNVSPALTPNLTIMMGGANDWASSGGSPPSGAFTTQISSVITIAKSTGDCIIVSDPPSDPAQAPNVSLAVQAQWVAAMKAAALAASVPFIDVFGYFGSWAAANAKGWMFDKTHPNGAGYAAIAGLISTPVINPSVVFP